MIDTYSHRLRAAVGLLAALGLLGAACGPTSAAEDGPTVAALDEADATTAASNSTAGSADANPDEPPTEEEAEAAQVRFDRCMADQGIDVDELFGEVTDSGGGAAVEIEVDEEVDFEAMMAELDEANRICQPILEEVFGSFELSPEDESAFTDAQAAFSECMADAGFDIDTGDDGSMVFGFETDGDDIEPLESAMTECNKIMEQVLSDQGVDFGTPGNNADGEDGDDS